MRQAMITTTDNPYDPFKEYPQWYAFDEQMGYHSLSYLARIAVLSDTLSEADTQRAIEDAIDEIVEDNL